MSVKLPKRINLADVESTSERVAPGTYHAKVVGMEAKVNKAKTGYYFNVDLIITSEGAAKGRHIWDMLPLSEKALWRLKGFLAACGVEDDNPVTEEIPSLCIGSDVDVVVGEEEYEGEMQSKVRKIKPSTAPTMDDIAEDDDDDDDDEDGDEDGEGYTRDELEGMTLKEVKAIAKEYEIATKGVDKDDLIDAIIDAQGDADDDDSDDDDDDAEGDQYDEMDKKALKAECKERGLTGYKALDEDELREMLRENDAEGDGDDDDDEEGDDEASDDDDDDLFDDDDEEEEKPAKSTKGKAKAAPAAKKRARR